MIELLKDLELFLESIDDLDDLDDEKRLALLVRMREFLYIRTYI